MQLMVYRLLCFVARQHTARDRALRLKQRIRLAALAGRGATWSVFCRRVRRVVHVVPMQGRGHLVALLSKLSPGLVYPKPVRPLRVPPLPSPANDSPPPPSLRPYRLCVCFASGATTLNDDRPSVRGCTEGTPRPPPPPPPIQQPPTLSPYNTLVLRQPLPLASHSLTHHSECKMGAWQWGAPGRVGELHCFGCYVQCGMIIRVWGYLDERGCRRAY